MLLLIPSIIDNAIKLAILILEGQTVEQRVKMTGWGIAWVEQVRDALSPEARAKLWKWWISVIEQLKLDPSPAPVQSVARAPRRRTR
jgi:hypothetical protein